MHEEAGAKTLNRSTCIHVCVGFVNVDAAISPLSFVRNAWRFTLLLSQPDSEKLKGLLT